MATTSRQPPPRSRSAYTASSKSLASSPSMVTSGRSRRSSRPARSCRQHVRVEQVRLDAAPSAGNSCGKSWRRMAKRAARSEGRTSLEHFDDAAVRRRLALRPRGDLDDDVVAVLRAVRRRAATSTDIPMARDPPARSGRFREPGVPDAADSVRRIGGAAYQARDAPPALVDSDRQHFDPVVVHQRRRVGARQHQRRRTVVAAAPARRRWGGRAGGPPPVRRRRRWQSRSGPRSPGRRAPSRPGASPRRRAARRCAVPAASRGAPRSAVPAPPTSA